MGRRRKVVENKVQDRVADYDHRVLTTDWSDRLPQYELIQTKHPWISTYTENYQNPYHELYEKEDTAQDMINDMYNLKRAEFFKNKAHEGLRMKLCFNLDKPHNMRREPFFTNVVTEDLPNCFQEQKLYNIYHLGETLENSLKRKMFIDSGLLVRSDKPAPATVQDQECLDSWKGVPGPFFEDKKFKEKLEAQLHGLHLLPPPMITETHEVFHDPDIKEFEGRRASRRDIAHTIDTVCATYKDFRTRDLDLIYSPDYPIGSLDKYLSRKPQDILPAIPQKKH